MSQSTMSQKVIKVGVIVIAFTGIIATLDAALATPIVQVSNSTNECVKVINFESTFFVDKVYSCESMPTKYTHEWVQ